MDKVEGSTAETTTSLPLDSNSERPREGRSWADIPLDEPVDYTEELVWPDTEEDSHLIKVSENTERFLKVTFAKPVPNQTRRQWHKEHRVPRVDATKCPKLDKVVKCQLPKEAKTADLEALMS